MRKCKRVGEVPVRGERLSELIKASEMPLKAFAKSISFSESTLRTWLESVPGRRKCVRSELVAEVAEELEIPVDELIDSDPQEIPELYVQFLQDFEVIERSARCPNIAGRWILRVDLDDESKEKASWNRNQPVSIPVVFHQHNDAMGFKVQVEDQRGVVTWIIDGCLSESGTTISGAYRFIDPDKKVVFGFLVGTVDGETMSGKFVGRNPTYKGVVGGTVRAKRVYRDTPLGDGPVKLVD